MTFTSAILDHSDRPIVLRAVVLLIGLAWTIPFLQPYHRFPLTAFYSEWVAFALGLAAAAWLLTREPWRDATMPLIAAAPLALAALLAVQVALDRVPYAEQALTAGLYLLWAALMAVLGHSLGRRLSLEAIATTLAWFLLAGGVLHALIGLVQHYNVSTPINFMIAQRGWPAIYGNVGQINHYAASIALSLISATYLCSRGNLATAAAAACAALLLVALALAGSRSAWLYLAMLFVLALVVHRRLRNDASRRIAVFACLFPLGFVAALWLVKLPMLLPAGGPEMMGPGQRVFQIASGVGPRLELWGEAWQLFLTAPVLGAGLGQFAWHHFLHNDPASGATGTVFSHAHNVVLQLMAETGVAGALIIVGAVLAWIMGLRRVRLDPAWWWLLSALAVIGIHSLLEYPLWYSYFLGPAALLLGLGAQHALPMRFPGAARAAVALAVLVGCVNLAAVILAYRDFERLVFTPGEQHASPALSDQAFAEALTKVHDEPLLRPYVELAMAYAVSVDRAQLEDKLEIVTRAMRFAPVDTVAFRQAQLLALAGRAEAAREQLERSLRAYPYRLESVVAELTALARLYPSEMGPLLELTASKIPEGRESRERK